MKPTGTLTLASQLDQLDGILGHQIAGFTALKNWLPKKMVLVKENRLAELEAFNEREDSQVARLEQLEGQRQVVLSMIALELGYSPLKPPSLLELVPLAPEAYRARLSARGEQLAALTLAIREGHARVSELLRVSLDYTHYSLDVFAQLATATAATSYGDDGDAEPPQRAAWLVDHQA